MLSDYLAGKWFEDLIREDYYAMHFLCYQKEGLHVLHKVLPYGEDIDEPSGLLLTCIRENPEVVLFSCFYSMTYEDL